MRYVVPLLLVSTVVLMYVPLLTPLGRVLGLLTYLYWCLLVLVALVLALHYLRTSLRR